MGWLQDKAEPAGGWTDQDMTLIGRGGRAELQVPLLAVASAGADPNPGQLGDARMLTADTTSFPPASLAPCSQRQLPWSARNPRKTGAVTFTDNCAARPMMDPATAIRPGSEHQTRRVRPPKV